MNEKVMLQILGSLELNISKTNSNLKVVLTKIDSFNCGILIYSVKSYRITFLKLCLNQLCSFNVQDVTEILSNKDCCRDLFKTYLLDVFCLPFELFVIVTTNQNIWVIGSKTAVDLKPYIESALKEGRKDDVMETDATEEFHKMFETIIHIHQPDLYNFHISDIVIGCDFINYGVINCHAKPCDNIWQLELILLQDGAKLSSVNSVPILNIPMTVCKNSTAAIVNKDKIKKHDPVIIFIHQSEPEICLLQNIFGISCSTSNIICLVGHPDGSLIWTSCDLREKCHSQELQTLYNTKQSIIGIHFIEGSGKFKDCEFLLLIGALGQITIFSSQKFPFFTAVPGNQPFWILTTHLKSSIKNSFVIQNCLLHTSHDGMLWITDISTLLNVDVSAKETVSASKTSDMCCIDQVIIVDKVKGLVLLKSLSGNMYLAACTKETDFSTHTSSLPSLMNECLLQSSIMQELLHVKNLQNRLYRALSIFSSLKFGANEIKKPVEFSITAINLQPKKYILIINLQFLDKLHLDPELFHINTSIFTYLQSDYTLVSKTLPYNLDQPTLCLELTDTILQPPFTSIFPLYVEIGLILQLPEHWRTIDCFKTLSACLPFYYRAHSFMIHELHLFHSNTICQPQMINYEHVRDCMEQINLLGMKRPIYNLMPAEKEMNLSFPAKFNLCLSLTSVELMMEGSLDTNPCAYVQKYLFNHRQSTQTTQETPVISKSQFFTISVNRNNKILGITLNASSVDALVSLRIAVMDIFLASQNQQKYLLQSSAFVNIPATIYRRCEEISSSLRDVYGKDVDSDEVTDIIVKLYQEFRKDVSGKLPLL